MSQKQLASSKLIASKNRNAKLSVEDIYEIHRLYKKGCRLRRLLTRHTYAGVAKKYNIRKNQIYCVLNGKTYKHIKVPGND